MIALPNTDPLMIANNLSPFEPTHPGELIRDELEARAMALAKLASQIGVSSSLLNEVINGKRGINTELALLFEASLGISAEFWIDLQTDYNMQVAKSNKSFMNQLAAVLWVLSKPPAPPKRFYIVDALPSAIFLFWTDCALFRFPNPHEANYEL